MKMLRHVSYFLFIEPLSWLLFCFFQPTKLAEIESPSLLRGAMRLLRLLLPLLLVSYVIALLSELVSYGILHFISIDAPPSQNFLSYQPILLFFVTAWTLFSVLSGILSGISTGIALSLAFAGSIGIIFGGIGITIYEPPYYLMYGCALGVALGVPFSIKESLPAKNIFSSVATGLTKGIVVILVLSMAITPDLFLQSRLDGEFGFSLGDSGMNLVNSILLGVVLLCSALAFTGDISPGLLEDISPGFGEDSESLLKRRIKRGLKRALIVTISSSIALQLTSGIFSIIINTSAYNSGNILLLLPYALLGLTLTAIGATLVIVFTKNWRLHVPVAAVLGIVSGIGIYIIYIAYSIHMNIGFQNIVVPILGCLIGLGVSLVVYSPASWKRTLFAGGGASVIVMGLTGFFKINFTAENITMLKTAIVYSAILAVSIGVVISFAVARPLPSGRRRIFISALMAGVVTGVVVGSIEGIFNVNLVPGLGWGIGVGISVAIGVGIITSGFALTTPEVMPGKTRGLIVGLISGVIAAFAWAVYNNNAGAFIIATIVALAAGITASNRRSIALIFTACLLVGLLFSFLVTGPLSASIPILAINQQAVSSAVSYVDSFLNGYLFILLFFGLAAGLIASIVYSIGPTITSAVPRGIIISLYGGVLVWGVLSSNPVYLDLKSSFLGGLIVCITCMAMYLLIYFRLLLYAVSSLYLYRAYQVSKKKQERAAQYLSRSAFYWDEMIPFPLPYLKGLLLLAAELDRERALEEIEFILSERTKQKGAAQAALLEVAMRDLEKLSTIEDIAGASERLGVVLSSERIDAVWKAPLASLFDASREAEKYHNTAGWLNKYNALTETINKLKPAYGRSARDADINQRLEAIFNKWREIFKQQLEKLKQSTERDSVIENYYSPGQVLSLDDPLFKGRDDLVQQLSNYLGNSRIQRTFLLQGERRMGKSSILKQLPRLLGAQYLPSFIDAQLPSTTTSVDALLGAIAGEIDKTLGRAGIQVKKLRREQIKSAKEGDAYGIFDEWFSSIEEILEKQNRTLLLTIDEFEKLDEAGSSNNFQIHLLLDWFRSIIQYHPRLALLFSGLHRFSDMGGNWANRFVNAQTLKVSFLQHSEAEQLITQPAPQFPAEEIYGEGVVEEIIRLTNCHPFLIQAVCDKLLNTLITEKRSRVELDDVANAANLVLMSWETYFSDLWNRTKSEEQRGCLFALIEMGDADFQSIQQHTKLDKNNVGLALEQLLVRDLILKKQDTYCISVPLITRWIENSPSARYVN